MKHFYLLLSAFVIGGFSISQAQPTGDFVKSFVLTSSPIAGDTLDIYFHIPANFDFNQSAKMIVGIHGLGTPDNSMEIRQFLTPVADSLNAILMCPDPYLQDQPKSKAALNEALDSAHLWYNINTSERYIAGYSAGSDVAAKYVFDAPKYPMKGLIWHSPGFFANPSSSDLSVSPPICLCWGDADFVSILQNNTLDNTIGNSGVPYHHVTMPGVAHTMDYPTFPQVMKECIDFIDVASVSTNDITVKEIKVWPNPARVGEVISFENLSPKATMRLIDMAGREYSVIKGNNSVKLPDGIAEGVYLLNAITDDEIYRFKLLVRK